MPGIMPMKIIKVGSSAQSRVAQACDRCRSKKIRCDGITPCCTQCANVGFECKTSDKLSRRAFPRGYTESLEERVRQLEAEVRDLKGLLDEKDEKIDLLSKFHDFSTSRGRSGTLGSTKAASQQSPEPFERDTSDTFPIKQQNNLIKTPSRTEPHWAGASSSMSFLDIFKTKIAESGRAVPLISPRALFPASNPQHRRPVGGHARRPPRLVSDRLVNVFLQEIAPLFPVLYRSEFLQHYREFAEGFNKIENQHVVAQLNLVLSIAATASGYGQEHIPAFDNHWHSALNSIIHDNSLATLQCLLLAQFCCLCRGDSTRILHYAGIAIIMSRRLGLHKLQADLSLDALTTELRKRTFWCLYTLDTFIAAYLGLPRLIKDEIVQTEMPIDVDDEDLSKQRATAASPETKMSASLALFTLARIFSRVIDNVYQSTAISGISIQKVAELSDLLDGWRDGLSPHLRLTFSQDKPSTNITGDRSPLLSLAYYNVRALLHRPLATSDLGAKAVPSAMTLADSSKHIVQIVQLLDERRMSFALPLSRSEVLVTAGLGLLYQGLTITSTSDGGSPAFGSSIVNENQRLVCAIMSILDSGDAPCASDFKSLACALITVNEFRIRRSSAGSNTKSVSPRSSISQVSLSNSSESLTASSASSQSPVSRLLTTDGRGASTGERGQSATIAQRRAMAAPGKLRFPSHNSMFAVNQQAYKTGLTPTKSEPTLRTAAATQRTHQISSYSSQVADAERSSIMLPTGDLKSLDYLPFSNDTSSMSSMTPVAQGPNVFEGSSAQWDHILGCLSSTSVSVNANAAVSPSIEIFSPGNSGTDGNFGVAELGVLDWTGGHDPVSTTAWTESTGVPSVFDDSGASLTSGDEARSSIDTGKGSATDLRKEIDYLADASGLDLNTSLTGNFGSLQGLDVNLQT